MTELCCCQMCGRIIDYWQYHRNDVQSEYKGYCYSCEDYILKIKENERGRNKTIHANGCE